MGTYEKVLVLGGYGNAGGRIAERLLRETQLSVVLAGRSQEKASAKAAELSRAAAGRVSGLAVDAHDPDALRAAFEAVDCVIVASSTGNLTEPVARAALEAGVDCLDINLSSRLKLDALEPLADRIKAAGCCFVTDCGYTPGVPGLLVRWAADRVDAMQDAWVAGLSRLDMHGVEVSPATGVETAEHILHTRMLKFAGGEWIKAGLSERKTVDFGAPFGSVGCMAVYFEELGGLPKNIPSLRNLTFWASGFNWVVDYLVMPAGMALVAVAPRRGLRPFGKMLQWGLANFGKPPYGVVLTMQATGPGGTSAGITLSHPEAYDATAIPVVATVLQLLDGDVRRPGLHFQAQLLEPQRALTDLERMGFDVHVH